MTVDIHPLAKAQCVADLCEDAAESIVVVAPACEAGATTSVRLCELHAFSMLANSEEIRDLLFEAEKLVDTGGISDGVTLRKRIRSYLDLD